MEARHLNVWISFAKDFFDHFVPPWSRRAYDMLQELLFGARGL